MTDQFAPWGIPEIIYGPTLAISEQTHAEKYRGSGESFEEAMTRIAAALKDDDDHFRRCRDILLDMRFMPAGRIQAAMGAPKRVTPYNCFVAPTIPDSMSGIMEVLITAAETMRMGGGIGYDFSTLRPKGSRIFSLDSKSSGPIAFMDVYDALCRTILSAGHRRGAQMGVLRVDHPDIQEFIHAKQNTSRLTNFNISVGVTDEFMHAVEQGLPFQLRFGDREYERVDAQALWEQIMRSTWDWAEPGVLFLDTINRMNPLGYCETIRASNPCAEQPLPPNGACLLGSINLTRYVWTEADGSRTLHLSRLLDDLPDIIRMMDNVIDRATYPLPQQAREAKMKRRMGIGVTGVANALEALGHPYGSPAFLETLDMILRQIKEVAYDASSELGLEKGSFADFRPNQWLDSGFAQTLPGWLRLKIEKYGLRNSHLLSIAPTGTISLCADNISSGIEPVFAYTMDRTIQGPDGPRIEELQDYGFRTWGTLGKLATQLTAQEHLDVLLTATKHVDSAVSKTININPKMSWEEFKGIYMKAWRGGAKGCTTFNPHGKRMGILNASPRSEENEGSACFIDPTTGQKECS